MCDCYKLVAGDRRSSRPKKIVPLTLENLPWDPETRVKEENTYRIKVVLNKRDPNWYRPNHVLMKVSTMWTIRRYLNDINTQTQYTIGDMEDILGIPRTSETPLWMSVLLDNHRETLKLKVPKPFELAPYHIQSEVQQVYDVMRDIGNRIRLPGYARQEADLRLVDVSESETNFDGKLKMTVTEMCQSHLDIMAKHGCDESCFVQLMKLGDNEGLYVSEEKTNGLKEKGTCYSLSEPGHVNGKKQPLTYWEKLHRRKTKRRLKKELRAIEKCWENNNMECATIDKVNDLDKSSLKYQDNNIATNGNVCGSSIDREFSTKDDDNKNAGSQCKTQDGVEETEKKMKKKRGLLKTFLAPFRWVKKKLFNDNH